MNENTFLTQRTHTRVKFQPLRVTCSLVCLTDQSPMAQAVNTLLSPVQYEPDRSLTPTLVLPDVRAIDPDGVFTHGSVNEYLSLESLKWTVDGEPIDEVWTSGEDYEIVRDANDYRGALRIFKNLNASEKAVLHFEGEFYDWRTGIVYQAISDERELTSTDKGADVYACSVDKPLVEYDPLYDDLLLYEYKVSHGMNVVGSRAQYVNGKCYEQTVAVCLTAGQNAQSVLPAGLTMRLVVLGQSTEIVANSEANPEVLAVAFPNVKFDMRMIGKKEYEVQFLKGSVIVTRCTIGLATITTMPATGKPMFGSDLVPSLDWYKNTILLNLSERFVECPELYYDLLWKTQAKYDNNGTWEYAQEKTWQYGEEIGVAVKDLGIGVTVNDSFFDQWCEVNAHQPRELCLDEDDEVLTDEDGEYLID